MNVTKKLVDEHKNILKVADALIKKAEECEKGKADKKFFEEAVFFIRNYADKFHHAKEEDILFKAICTPEAEMHCNPVEQMLHEHELGRSFVKEMEEGAREVDAKKIGENARKYACLIREHIFKEDNILYPMCEEGLSEKAKKEMIKAFEMADEKAKDTESKCLNIARRLAKNE